MVLDLIETAFDIEDRSCFVRFLAALHRFKRDSSIHPERERFAEVGVIDLADVDGLLLEVGKLIEHLERIERKVEAPGKIVPLTSGEDAERGPLFLLDLHEAVHYFMYETISTKSEDRVEILA